MGPSCGVPCSHPLALGGWGPPDPSWGASEALHPQPRCRTPAWRKVAPPGLQGRSAQAGASVGVMCFLPGQRGGLSWPVSRPGRRRGPDPASSWERRPCYVCAGGGALPRGPVGGGAPAAALPPPPQRPYDVHSSNAVESLVQLFSTVSVQYVPTWSKEMVALLRKVSPHPTPHPTLRKHRLPACTRPCRSRRALCHLAVAGPVRALAVSRMPCARRQLNPTTWHHPISQMPKLRRRPPCHTCRGGRVRAGSGLLYPTFCQTWVATACCQQSGSPPGSTRKRPQTPLAPPTAEQVAAAARGPQSGRDPGQVLLSQCLGPVSRPGLGLPLSRPHRFPLRESHTGTSGVGTGRARAYRTHKAQPAPVSWPTGPSLHVPPAAGDLRPWNDRRAASGLSQFLRGS